MKKNGSVSTAHSLRNYISLSEMILSEPNMTEIRRKNHEVPKGLLKNWLGTSLAGEVGIHYLPVGSLPKFETGEHANFAIFKDLYVPNIAPGGRDDSLEVWFSVDENGLAPFAKAAQTGTLDKRPKIVGQALRACIALGYRCSYHSFMVAQSLETDDKIKSAEAAHLETVKNSWAIYAHKFKQFSNWSYLILHDLPGSLLVNEQPFRDWTLREGMPPIVTMALGPNALLMGTPPDGPPRQGSSVGITPASDRADIVKMHNHIVIETARQWVVSTSEAQLQAIAGDLTYEKVSQRRRTDREVWYWIPNSEAQITPSSYETPPDGS